MCNADVRERLRDLAKITRFAGLRPVAAIFAPTLRINDAQAGRWNKSRISGILMRGTVSAALR